MSDQFLPTVCIDDFLMYPDALREYALSLDYYDCAEHLKSDDTTLPNGSWPGKRTKALHVINEPLFLSLTNKFLSIFFDFDFHNINWNIQMYFQLCSPNQYGDINNGWIHHDGKTLYAGVLYLTPDAPPSTGTSLYKKRSDCLDFDAGDFAMLSNSKKELYSNFNSDKIEEYKKMLEYNNSKFIETANFNNIYNRLIGYSGNIFHGVKNYYGDDMTNERLTLVFFINTFESNWNPIQTMRNHNI
jgi:hypothetical protein